MIEKRINEHIQEDIEKNLEDQDLWKRKGILWKNLKETISFGSGDIGQTGDFPEKKTTGEVDNDPEKKNLT